MPVLQANGTLYTKDAAIASELVTAFFPPAPDVTGQDQEQPTFNQFPDTPLGNDEIRRAVFACNPSKNPGLDGLPALVWQKTWSSLGTYVCALFKESLAQSRLPESWKTAKIIPLKKQGEPDYTALKAYRPISLLTTLGKALEYLVAERISFLVEEHSLVPATYFSGRKRLSTVQALTYFQEKVCTAWKKRKVLSMVTFDNKGAFNRVSKTALLARLRHRQIPEQLVGWIDDFCSSRQVSVLVNGYSSPKTALHQAGLSQGSPLSPILFLFLNADLVQHDIREGGSFAYVDDYTAWIVRDSAAINRARIEGELLPVLQKWEKSSSATFAAEKTQFCHFSRCCEKIDGQCLTFKD